MKTPNKACNPLDEIEICTLKKIFGWEMDVVDNPHDHSCTILQTLILGLVNSVLSTGFFPEPIMKGVVIPLYKNGDPRDLNNYRGITLLSTLYKIITKILNTRLLQICEESGALSQYQAGGRANWRCLTQITILQNIIKHSHRNDKAHYLLSTDVRKAFDTVDHEAFLASMRAVGFEENVIRLIMNLQSGFECQVNTPLGLTEPFKVEQGCKQGCAVSPLRFIILYDIFLKFLQHSNKGYKWKCMSWEDTLTIPAGAFMDDMILIADNAEDFRYMAEMFDKFLRAVGLSLNAKKCHYTSVNTGDQNPDIWCSDEKGVRQQILRADGSVPMIYLGYALRVDNCQGKLTDMWRAHNLIIDTKIRKAASRFARSRFGASEAINILNADITSVVPYFSHANWMPEGGGPKFGGLRREDEEEDREPQAVSMKSMAQLLRRVAVKKLRLQPNTPTGAIFNSSRGLGFGINNIRAICATAKIDNVLAALQSPCVICRKTTLDTIWEIQISKGWNVLDPREGSITACALQDFPAFYRDCGIALRQANTRIEINDYFFPLVNRHPLLICENKIVKSNRKDLSKIFKEYEIRNLDDLVPGLVVHNTGLHNITRTVIENLLNGGKFTAAKNGNNNNPRGKHVLKQFQRYLLDGLRDRIAKGDFVKTDESSWMSTEVRDMRGKGGSLVASDGAAKDGTAAWGVVSIDGRYIASDIKSGYDVDEAEATGALVALSTAKHGVDVCVVSDSESTIAAVERLRTRPFYPKAYREIRNYSIIKTLVDEIWTREALDCRVTLRKVKAHANIQDDAHELHRRADILAKSERVRGGGRFLVGPCLHNLPRAFLIDGRGDVRETKTHSLLLEGIDEHLIQRHLDDPKVSRHMKLWELGETWLEASATDKRDELKVFRSKMFCKSLPTPRNIQITNMVKYPNLYPECRCPLCEDGQGDDFHIFCECESIAERRDNIVSDCCRAINLIAGTNFASLGLTEFILCPRVEMLSKQGQIHDELRRKVEYKFGQEGVTRLAKPLGKAIGKAYHRIWSAYTETLVEWKLDFDSRLRQEYDTTANNIRRHFSLDTG